MPYHYHPTVNQLKEELLWEVNDLEEAVQNALSHDIPDLEKYGVTSAKGFLDFANWLIQGWIPTETTKGRDIYYIICIFYFVLAQEPLASRQTPIHPDSVGKHLTPLSEWVVKFAQDVGAHLDQPSSIQNASELTFWNAPTFRLYEAERPVDGWKTFNQFFSRKLKPDVRPIASPDDDQVVVFPADSTFAGAYLINEKSEVTLKTPVEGGVWMHCFLNTFDYHRQHAPVSGKILHAEVIKGAAYLEVVVKKDEQEGHNSLEPCRIIRGRSKVKSDQAKNGIHTVDAPNTPGYQFLQTRGLIIIENPTLGKVAVLPIGMAQVSSVKLVDKLQGHFDQKGNLVADEPPSVQKGEEISYFEFGGSDCVMLFEQNARVSGFPSSKSQTHFFYGEKLATAHPIEAEPR